MKTFLKMLVILTIVMGFTTAGFAAGTVKIGVLQGFTGPIESLTPPMAQAAEFAIKEASDSGAFLGGTKIVAVRGDSTCVDAAAATAAAERLVNSEKVIAIVGASCSGATTAVVNKVSATKGVVTISSSATSPALTYVKDKGYFFRTAPSDARQGQVCAQIAINRGVKDVALTYTNNDYGKGLAEAFSAAFKKLGGKIYITAAHEDGKADYTADVAALSASGAKDLVLFGYLDQGGRAIIQASMDTGAFDKFVFGDGMIGNALIEGMGDYLNGSFGTMPGGENEAAQKWKKIAKDNDIPIDGPFRDGSYDAAALIILAAQAGKSTDRASIQKNIMKVANAPGEKIFAGELKKGLEILAKGGEIDYVGAKDIEFSEVGEIFGTYQEMEVIKQKFQRVKVH